MADIARRLDAIQSDMAQGFQRVDEALNAAKVRDEEILSIAKLGLEATQTLDEKVDRRFADTDRAMAALAASTGLTAYDASYLWLAISRDVELVTLDRGLARIDHALREPPTH